jgi:predicted dithiol-disulfide oxidoreductase (DUF899 family)
MHACGPVRDRTRPVLHSTVARGGCRTGVPDVERRCQYSSPPLWTNVWLGSCKASCDRVPHPWMALLVTSRRAWTRRTSLPVQMLSLDVRADDSVRTCVAAAVNRGGRLDVLINNAGYQLAGALEELSLDEARAQFETNFFGVVRMVNAVLPLMRQQRHGHIVNVSSLTGLTAIPFLGIYSQQVCPGRLHGSFTAGSQAFQQAKSVVRLRGFFPQECSNRECGGASHWTRLNEKPCVDSTTEERKSSRTTRLSAKKSEEKQMDKNKELSMNTPPVVSAQEWEAARQQLLVKEKSLTRARDALAAERRRMPWLAVEKAYEFDGPQGKASLLDLFDGRRQLVVYRAFFEPGVYGWPEHACRGCSFVADQVAHLAHLNARDTTLAFVSRAPLMDIDRLKARMDWTMPWYSITDSFDIDFGVDEWHGTNAFIRDGDNVFRTYFINNRGDEQMGSTWNYLDITALGRQEDWEDSPEGYPKTPPYKWWNWHDEYGDTVSAQWSSVVDRSLALQGQPVGTSATSDSAQRRP